MLLPFPKTKIKQINAHMCILTKPFQLCANYSYFAQGIYLIDKTDKIPCAILEWSDTILELPNQIGILTLCRVILDCYRLLLCAEHMHTYSHMVDKKFKFSDLFMTNKTHGIAAACLIVLMPHVHDNTISVI